MFIPTKDACKILKIHPHTLRRLAKEGRIEFIKVSRTSNLYNVDKFIEEQAKETKENE